MSAYSLEDFDSVPSAKEIVYGNVDLQALPDVESVKTLARWSTDMLELFNRDAQWFAGEAGSKQDRSAAMARLAYSGAEMGWEDGQIAAILYDVDDRWGKYVHRRDREKRLLDFVNRARAKVGYNVLEPIDLSRFGQRELAPVVSPEQAARPLIWGFNDFVEADFPINWMLEGLLAQGGLGLVTGFPGTGKTQFCIALAAHLALGADRFLKWDNIGGHKKVLFLSLEMGAAPLNLFMGTISKGYTDLRTLNKNLLVGPFGEPLPLDTPEGQAFLNNLLDEYMPDVIIIDSLQAVISKEMTDELAVKSFFGYLSVVREKYRCAMVIVHHNRKKSNDHQKKDVELSDVYGSTYIAAEVDFILSLRLTDPKNSSLLSVDQLKSRLGKMQSPFEMYRDENLGFSIDFENLMNQFPVKGEKDEVLTV